MEEAVTPDALEVLHKSQNFLVVNKQADLVINTDEGDNRISLFDQVRCKFPELYQPHLGHGYYVAHRLDYSTSGAVVIPLTKLAASQAAKQFELKRVKKFYLALLRGHVEGDNLEIQFPVGEDSRPEWERLRMSTPAEDEGCVKPRTATTRLVVLSRGLYDSELATKVLLHPLTGRRHQLRLHCHCLGHTIVGDWVYSDRKDSKPHRMFLHAHRIVLSTQVEHMDIVAGADPFCSSDPLNVWEPYEDLNACDLSQAYQRLTDDQADWTVIS